MATAFQSNAFQGSAFQVATGSEVVGATNLGDLLTIRARGKRGKHFARIGPLPDHDTNYAAWVDTNPGVSRHPGRRRNL